MDTSTGINVFIVGCTCFRTPYISSSLSLLFLKHHLGGNSEGVFCFLRNGTRTHTHTNIKKIFDCSTRFLIAVWYWLESHYLVFHVSGHNIWLFKNQRKPVTQIKLQTFLWHCYILVEEVMVVVGGIEGGTDCSVSLALGSRERDVCPTVTTPNPGG